MVAVWDVRRPFIPYAAFDTHTDDVTGLSLVHTHTHTPDLHQLFLLFADFVWLSEDVLVSCSKDCKLIQQLIGEASHPAERAVSLCDYPIEWCMYMFLSRLR